MTTEHPNPVPDLTIPLSTTVAQALGDDAGQMAMRLGAVLHGLTQLRAGGASTDGIRDAAVRQHAAQGGSYGTLASSMGATRATAQSRRDTL
ncbi:hypothetical protein AS594_35610 [Streptomyces agglomeratus]|uniref:Uncharacterized protein n=1 Tax=Streptomyces agglomeratus TaxID=285458 RepID=A0A1E5PHB9_9ACTN|nr:hypothetical protein [Streptomyces agglomeratus]OEJ28960.1 hypothetical protein AS594_35610 [Streptomyces agglomeratus]